MSTLTEHIEAAFLKLDQKVRESYNKDFDVRKVGDVRQYWLRNEYFGKSKADIDIRDGVYRLYVIFSPYDKSQQCIDVDVKFDGFYCQRNIEGVEGCVQQCDHCEEYYKPLEK